MNQPEAEEPDANVPGASIPDSPDTDGAGVQKPEETTPDAGDLSYARQVVELVNEQRAKAGLPALEMKEDITEAANIRAREIEISEWDIIRMKEE